MTGKKGIAQHQLIDRKGQAVGFLIEDWGKVHDYSYDYLKAHRHDFYEIMVFQKGKARHDIDFSSFTAKSGEVHFVAPDNVHLLLREKQSEGFSIQFTNGFFSAELVDNLPFNTSFPKLRLNPMEFKNLLFLTSQINIELDQKQHLSDKLLRTYFEAILLLLLRNAKQSKNLQETISQSPHIDSFKRLVKTNYKSHFTVEQYAALLHISTKHLIEICKEQTGKTPLKIIQEAIISEAKRLLFHTQDSIKDIAYSLGFDDPANFSKYFKNASGFSPLAYRQEAGK